MSAIMYLKLKVGINQLELPHMRQRTADGGEKKSVLKTPAEAFSDKSGVVRTVLLRTAPPRWGCG